MYDDNNGENLKHGKGFRHTAAEIARDGHTRAISCCYAASTSQACQCRNLHCNVDRGRSRVFGRSVKEREEEG